VLALLTKWPNLMNEIDTLNVGTVAILVVRSAYTLV